VSPTPATEDLQPEYEERVAWSAQPGPQSRLITCPIEDIFYGGARGGGKTDGLLGDFLTHQQTYHSHARGIIFRKTFPQLAEIISRAREIYTPLGWTYNSGEHLWTARDGGTLRLGYLETDGDVENYIGHQYSWMGFDQLEQWLVAGPIDKLWGSLRSPWGVPCLRRSTGNPPAPAWVKERYIDPFVLGNVPFTYQPLEDRPELTIEAIFIPAKLEDNPLLVQNDPGYEARLAAVGDKRLFQAWRYGRWDVQIGQVFEEWRADLHVIQGFHVPRHWELAGGLDWGYRAPGWFGLFASGPDGDVICVAELYFRQKTGTDIGRAIGRLCRQTGRSIAYIAGDEQMWYKTGVTAPTIGEEVQNGIWEAYGGHIEHAPRLVEATHGRGSRMTKLTVMHEFLAWKELPDGTVPPWWQPRLRFVASCKAAIRTIPALPYDVTKPEDVDTDAEDHAYDGVCAYLMSRPIKPDKPPKPRDPEKHEGFVGKRRREVWKEAIRQARTPSTAGRQNPLAGYQTPRNLVPLEPEDL